MTISRTTLARLGVACAAAVLWPAAAAAQITSPREAGQIEFGPLSIYPSLQIVDLGMDENVFNDSGEPKSDFTFTVASRALAVLRLGLNELMFSSGSDYVWFKEFKSERSSNAVYALRFNLSASRFKPFIGAEHMRTRARPNPEIDARARRVEQTLIAGSNFNMTERTAISVMAQLDGSSYEQGEQFRGVELDDVLSRNGRMYSAGFRYSVTPLTTLSISGNYREDIFRQSHLRDSKAYSLTPVVEFAPEAAIRGRFSAGYEVFKPEDPTLADHRGFVTEGSLNWAMATTTFDLTIGRNVSYSYQDTEPYYVQTGARLVINQRLWGPFGLIGSVDRQHLSYRWQLGAAAVPGREDRIDTTDVLRGGVNINLGRGFTLLLGAEKTRRHSSRFSLQNFNRTRLLSTVTIGQ